MHVLPRHNPAASKRQLMSPSSSRLLTMGKSRLNMSISKRRRRNLVGSRRNPKERNERMITVTLGLFVFRR